MKLLRNLPVILAWTCQVAVFIACEDNSCQESQEAIAQATQNYTDALDAGGDGAAECAALRTVLEDLINSSNCSTDEKEITQGLLTSLDCD